MTFIAQEKTNIIYRHWAPVYDYTFALTIRAAHHERARLINHLKPRNLLDVGVGTGLFLPLYHPGIIITGIDTSEEMLEKAHKRREHMGLDNITKLDVMDATAMTFPDNHFEMVVACHVVTVVPDPSKLIAEMIRVCKIGGHIILQNHFFSEGKIRRFFDHIFQPIGRSLGWNSVMKKGEILNVMPWSPIEDKPLPPWNLFSYLRFMKTITPKVRSIGYPKSSKVRRSSSAG